MKLPPRTLPRPLAWFLEQIFPAVHRRCAICGAVLPSPSTVGMQRFPEGTCQACQAHLQPRTGGFCPRCGRLFAVSTEPATLCLECRLSPPPWKEVYFFGSYDGLLKDLVLRFKFQSQLGLVLVLREMLTSALENRNAPHFDLAIPIPLHPRKLRARGFNQSLELLGRHANHVFTASSPSALVRVRNTPAQHNLPRNQRLHNMKGAFFADSSQVRGRSVLLVDDILTTGATAQTATKALLKAGATKVSLAVLARA